MNANDNTNRSEPEPVPWWRVRMLWLVIGGPALVVIASFATLILAISGADTPLRETASAQSGAHVPATQARNHVVAPGR